MLEKIITYIPPIIGLITISLFVYKSNKGSITNKIFILLNLLIAVWLLFLFTADISTSNSLALVAIRCAVATSTLSALCFVFFCINFPIKNKVGWRIHMLLAMPILVLAGLALTPLMVSGVSIESAGARLSSVSSLYTLDTIVIVGYFLLGSYILYRNRKKSSRIQKRQIDLLFIGIGIAVGVNVVTGYVFAALYIGGNSVLLGNLSLLAFVSITAYAIVKHGLFNVRLAAVRSASYVLALVTLSAIYYLLAYIVSVTLFQGQVSSTVSVSPINILLALLLAFIFQPVKSIFDKLTNDIFYRYNYNSDDFFTDLSRELSTTTDLRSLLQRAAAVMSSTFNSEQSLFFVEYGENDRYITAGTSRHSQLDKSDVELINAYATDGDGAPIITSRLVTQNELSRTLSRHNIELVIPLKWGEGVLSYLFLGPQRSRDYTRRDIQVLETVSDELAIAIQNALSLHEVKEINATLQERIASATKELRESNVQLQRLDEAKDEFVSMASHQLRTPLTSVKGYISMVLEGDAGKISPTQTKLLQEAFTSSERMVHLINDFLNISRLQTGKFMIDKRAIDLSKIIGEEVASLDSTATAHALKLRYRAPSYFPILYLDEGKIRQVVMNFIDNSIYYSREHSTITVKLYVDAGDAVLEVHDTGIGVPEDQKAQLFGKFFRATNARKQRPDGTGIGLFLAKKVIVSHGGSMVFESVEGDGSTFGFRLPIKKLSAVTAHEADQLEQ